MEQKSQSSVIDYEVSPIKTGEACEIFPTSSSFCMIFFILAASGHAFLPTIFVNGQGNNVPEG
jgi:hypothetical protein